MNTNGINWTCPSGSHLTLVPELINAHVAESADPRRHAVIKKNLGESLPEEWRLLYFQKYNIITPTPKTYMELVIFRKHI